MRRLLAGEIASYRMEKRYYTAGGALIWINLHGSLVRSPDGTWRRVRQSRLPRSTYSSATPAAGPTGLLTPRPSPTPTPSGPPPLPCPTPSLVTVTPDPRNGPPTTYPVCPPVSR